jgi:carbamoyl-phosphate synthase/aspartate carbamoyltransferase/dihydroorotase
MTTLRLPGLIDVHVHLREPGGEHKEELSTGSAAALAGGVTMVLDMPNTYPPLVDAQSLANKRRLIERQALCDVGLYVGASETNAAEAARLAGSAVALKIYLDQTYGPLQMRNLTALLSHFRNWPSTYPIAVHAEGLSVAVAIGLARVYERRLHLCHISRADEISLIRAAKESGATVTCEVTPHHLLLTEADARRLGPFGSMKPPLATDADVATLWANLAFVDCVATDHAPHTATEKASDTPPPGVPGLETMLPLLLTAVSQGRLTMERLVQLTHEAPKRIFGLPPQPDTHVEVDTHLRAVIKHDGLQTKCGWTPFEGLSVQGTIKRVILRGHTAYEEGVIRVVPGFGKAIAPVDPNTRSETA